MKITKITARGADAARRLRDAAVEINRQIRQRAIDNAMRALRRSIRTEEVAKRDLATRIPPPDAYTHYRGSPNTAKPTRYQPSPHGPASGKRKRQWR